MTALFIGRFQPLHIGHITIIQNLLKRYDEVVVMIGSANKSRTEKNPWTLTERIEILNIVFGDEENISLMSQVDYPEDDAWWNDVIDKVGHIDQVYSGNPWVLSICEKHSMPSTSIEILYQLSATKIRRLLSQKKPIVDLVHRATHDLVVTSYELIKHALKSSPL